MVGAPLREAGNNILSMDYRADGQRFATAGLDKKIRIYDGATHKLICALGANPGDPQGTASPPSFSPSFFSSLSATSVPPPRMRAKDLGALATG